jgi:solute:Na+ symporter, SSS family
MKPMFRIALGPVDYAILLTSLAFVIGIGHSLKRYMKTSANFFFSGRSIPAWITGLPGWFGTQKIVVV